MDMSSLYGDEERVMMVDVDWLVPSLTAHALYSVGEKNYCVVDSGQCRRKLSWLILISYLEEPRICGKKKKHVSVLCVGTRTRDFWNSGEGCP